MAKKNQKWIQKAVDRMEKKGTIGSFTEYCGGKITAQCVEKALNSPDPKIRKKAQFYVNVVKKELGGLIRYANGGSVGNNTADSGLTETVGALNSVYGPAGAEALFDNAMEKAENYWNMQQMAAKYGMRIYARGGSVYLAEDGMEVPVQQQPQTQAVSQPAQSSSPPQISYEQYVAFVTAYPEFLDRFLNELNQQLQNMESSAQGEQEMEEQEETEPRMEEGGEIEGRPNPYDIVNKVKSVSDDLYGKEFKNPNEFKEAFYQSVRNKVDPSIDRGIIDKITTDALNSSKSDKIRTASSYLESYLLKNIKEEGGETGDDASPKSSYDFMEGLRDLLYRVKDKNAEDITTEVNDYLIDNNVGIDYITLKQNIERSKEIARTDKNAEMPLVFINTMGNMILKRYNQAAEASKKRKGGFVY